MVPTKFDLETIIHALDVKDRVESGEEVSLPFSLPWLPKFMDWLAMQTHLVGWHIDMRNDEEQRFVIKKSDAYRVPGEYGWRND